MLPHPEMIYPGKKIQELMILSTWQIGPPEMVTVERE
jgi:hypothetical protein